MDCRGAVPYEASHVVRAPRLSRLDHQRCLAEFSRDVHVGVFFIIITPYYLFYFYRLGQRVSCAPIHIELNMVIINISSIIYIYIYIYIFPSRGVEFRQKSRHTFPTVSAFHALPSGPVNSRARRQHGTVAHVSKGLPQKR